MKTIKFIIAIAVTSIFLGLMSAGAEDAQKPTIKPYILDTCAVCGMKFGDMGKPYAFVYKDRQINVCAQEEETTFKKDPKKYLKKIEGAEAKKKKN